MFASIRQLTAKTLALCAALVIVGGHLGMMQIVAWTGMIWTYSSEGSIVTAVEKTFDGQHPCQLCESISKVRDAEDQSPAKSQIRLAKLDAVLGVRVQAVEPSYRFVQWSPSIAMGETRLETPPVPPPRLS